MHEWCVRRKQPPHPEPHRSQRAYSRGTLKGISKRCAVHADRRLETESTLCCDFNRGSRRFASNPAASMASAKGKTRTRSRSPPLPATLRSHPRGPEAPPVQENEVDRPHTHAEARATGGRAVLWFCGRRSALTATLKGMGGNGGGREEQEQSIAITTSNSTISKARQ